MATRVLTLGLFRATISFAPEVSRGWWGRWHRLQRLRLAQKSTKKTARVPERTRREGGRQKHPQAFAHHCFLFWPVATAARWPEPWRAQLPQRHPGDLATPNFKPTKRKRYSGYMLHKEESAFQTTFYFQRRILHQLEACTNLLVCLDPGGGVGSCLISSAKSIFQSSNASLAGHPKLRNTPS